jgi:uridine kinase
VAVVQSDDWRRDDPEAATLRDVDRPADLPPSPQRRAVIERVARAVLALPAGRRVLVAVDGVDGAGKTVFADELAATIRPRRPVVRATIDRFHRPAAERYAKGRASPEGFYRDSYDLGALIGRLLDPFATGGEVVTGVFDQVADRSSFEAPFHPPTDAILVLDGIFLHRPELVDRWDLSVFLDVPFSVSIPRGAGRGYGDPDPTARENRRYVEGQRLYLADVDPSSRATFVIDNTDLAAPRVTRDVRADRGRRARKTRRPPLEGRGSSR